MPLSRIKEDGIDADFVSAPASSTDNTIPRFDGTTGKLLQGSGVVVDDSNNVTTKGIYCRVQPTATTSTAQLWLQNGGGSLLFGRDSSTSSSFGFEAYASHIYSEGAYPLHLHTNGVRHVTLEAAGNLLMRTGALGYGAGAGGTAVQPVDKSTTVTLNKPSGVITTSGSALAAGGWAAFSLLSSAIGQSDGLVVTPVYVDATSNWTDHTLRIVHIGSGSATLIITNTSGSTKSTTLVFNFQVIKGSTT